MDATIRQLQRTGLIGLKSRMSFARNQTKELWQSFMPRRKEIKNSLGDDLYSVEIYNETSFFRHFDPEKSFEKWAAIAVAEAKDVPTGMAALEIPAGQYAVFLYRGKASDASQAYRYIFGDWLPKSGLTLDNRPHFAVMGEKYRGDQPESEEEIWIPVNSY